MDHLRNLFTNFLRAYIQKNFEGSIIPVEYRNSDEQKPIKIIIDFQDIITFDSDLACVIETNFTHYQEILSTEIKKFLTSIHPEYSSIKHIFPCMINPRKALKLRALRSAFIGQLISIDGVVIRVSAPNNILIKAVFRCRKCNGEVSPICHSYKIPSIPTCQSKVCKKKICDFAPEKSIFLLSQRILIQEHHSDTPFGEIPRSIEVILQHQDVDSVECGNSVDVVGSLMAIPISDSPSSGFTQSFLCTSLHVFHYRNIHEISDPLPSFIEKIQKQSEGPHHSLTKGEMIGKTSDFDLVKRRIYDALDDINARYSYIHCLLQERRNNVKLVSRILEISKNTVKIARDYDPRQPIQPGKMGRPPMLNKDAKVFIATTTYASPEISAADVVAALVRPPFNINVCQNTVNTYRLECGFKYGPKIRETMQTEASLWKRMNFASTHILRETSWENVVFSDESWFEIGSNKQHVWRQRGDYRPEVCRVETSHLQKVLIWGAVGLGFKSELLFIEGTSPAETYIKKILRDSLVIEHANAKYGQGNRSYQ